MTDRTDRLAGLVGALLVVAFDSVRNAQGLRGDGGALSAIARGRRAVLAGGWMRFARPPSRRGCAPRHTPDDAPYVFDVHHDRAGSDYENVNVLAIHWRSSKVAELISVEVKLDFTARLVQQARNYGRFSDRVWIAAPLLAEAADASAALRDFDPQLFEHVVEAGLGILACRRRPGRSYEVLPVHWPRRLAPDPVEKEGFLERYRPHFEQAAVLAPRAGRRNPVFG